MIKFALKGIGFKTSLLLLFADKQSSLLL